MMIRENDGFSLKHTWNFCDFFFGYYFVKVQRQEKSKAAKIRTSKSTDVKIELTKKMKKRAAEDKLLPASCFLLPASGFLYQKQNQHEHGMAEQRRQYLWHAEKRATGFPLDRFGQTDTRTI
jgi:hypothetical protein